MMTKFLLLGLLITPTLWAQDASEEAIILNQELQFLEESANNVSIISASSVPTQQGARPIDTESLEQKYFGKETEDNVSTRAAAPKRRSF